jgi:hypothetical protein
MIAQPVRILLACTIAALAVDATAGAFQPQEPAAVTRMLGLFERLRSGAPVSFHLADREINEYLVHSLRIKPRPGLQSCSLKIFPQNYVSTFTVVDFDAVERWKPGTIPAVLRPALNGKRSIWVDYRFGGANGKMVFSVQKAYFEGVRLPALLVEKVIEIVAARQPEKFDTTKPVPLPFGLKSLWTEGNVIRGTK